jgi:hypothetical protein
MRTVQPLVAVEPTFATVTSPWKPPGQGLTVRYVAVHPCPLGGGDEGGGEEGGGDEGGGEEGGGDEGGGEEGGGDEVMVLGNCAKNWNTAADVHVLAPLVPVDPSTGSGVWSPSNAAHWTG